MVVMALCSYSTVHLQLAADAREERCDSRESDVAVLLCLRLGAVEEKVRRLIGRRAFPSAIVHERPHDVGTHRPERNLALLDQCCHARRIAADREADEPPLHALAHLLAANPE